MEFNISATERDDHQNFNELHDELDSDVDDDQFFEDNFSSSPSTSDGIQFGNQWYAYRGRINVFENGVNHQEVNNLPVQPPPLQPQPQEEETDFLEMDFEPEIENENEMLHGPNLVINGNHMDDNQLQNNQALENFNNQASTSALNSSVNHQHTTNNLTSMFEEPCSNFKNTGAKPKVLKQSSSEARCQKSNKQRHGMAVEGDDIFKITGHLSSQEFCDSQEAACSSSSAFPNRERVNPSSFFKPFRSPVKSCHNSHKQERHKQHQQNFEKQNESFLFEIEPSIRPRNSVTIYTSNCDEKILMDALTSIDLNPDREMITNYFKELKQAQDLGLVDYVINRSKLNCNYIKLIELIEKACKNEEDESYSSRRIEINFYPLDFFSTTPEMIEVEVHEIIKRWSPQTDLTPLACIKNKHFYQTNVLGKIVNLIRRVNGNHKPGSVLIFRENESIKIPQFYVSGYITITLTSLRSYQT